MHRSKAAVAAAILPALAMPGRAEAHGIGGATEPGLPAWLFAWGAAAVLAISFAALGAFWRSPRLQRPRERRVCAIPRWLDPACGALAVAGFVALIYAGLAGAQASLDNILPTWVYVVFWVGVPVASALVGDVFRPFNPWRAIARAIRFVAGRNAPAPMPYPARLGRWPAVVTVVAFGWLELVYANRDDPATLALLGIAYAMAQLVAMSVFGIDEWERRGDGFAVYFGLFARLAPLDWRDHAVWLRRPLEGAARLSEEPGTVALVCAAIGVTTFDGLSAGPAWADAVPTIQGWFVGLGFSIEGALELASTIGLLACVAVIAAGYRLAAGHAVTYAHTLIPIALAYVVAHYATLLIFQGQALIPLASDPLGRGDDWFGTATVSVNYGLVGASAIWLVQVAAIVTGHVGGLALAHDRALALHADPDEAARSQRAMLAIMIGLTSLALWLISASNQ